LLRDSDWAAVTSAANAKAIATNAKARLPMAKTSRSERLSFIGHLLFEDSFNPVFDEAGPLNEGTKSPIRRRTARMAE
jgi:hypothetical protein